MNHSLSKIIKVCITFIFIIIVIVLPCLAADPQEAMLTVQNVEGQTREQTAVFIDIGENSHAASCSFDLKYDINKMKVAQTQKGRVLENENPSISILEKSGIVRLSYVSKEGLIQGGPILQVTFDILDNAQGDIPLVLGNIKMLTQENQEIPVKIINGIVKIENNASDNIFSFNQYSTWVVLVTTIICTFIIIFLIYLFIKRKNRMIKLEKQDNNENK